MSAGAERAMLARLLLLSERVPGSGGACLCEALVDFAYELESTRRLPEADAVLTLARATDASSAALALHAGRVARKQGDRERALELYRAALDLDAAGGAIGRLAQVGVAVVSPAAERELGRVIRSALRASDSEAAAVGLEERAHLRRGRGARRAAARDLFIAAARYADPVDRARVAHRSPTSSWRAAIPARRGRPSCLALAVGDGSQRDHARARLHTVSRDLGDQVGMRRWRSFGRPALVSLSARPRTARAGSDAPRLARWRERISAAAGGE